MVNTDTYGMCILNQQGEDVIRNIRLFFKKLFSAVRPLPKSQADSEREHKKIWVEHTLRVIRLYGLQHPKRKKILKTKVKKRKKIWKKKT